ncbi:hypothetical protein GGR56DRAFT_444655 [Xylariaceae sp. FL0804]|nr:hypothetical protein GGR56DRAFT_444655 [Xylariaceae sp. FL0804]
MLGPGHPCQYRVFGLATAIRYRASQNLCIDGLDAFERPSRLTTQKSPHGSHFTPKNCHTNIFEPSLSGTWNLSTGARQPSSQPHTGVTAAEPFYWRDPPAGFWGRRAPRRKAECNIGGGSAEESKPCSSRAVHPPQAARRRYLMIAALLWFTTRHGPRSVVFGGLAHKQHGDASPPPRLCPREASHEPACYVDARDIRSPTS